MIGKYVVFSSLSLNCKTLLDNFWKNLIFNCVLSFLYLFSILNHNASCRLDSYYSCYPFAYMAFKKMDKKDYIYSHFACFGIFHLLNI